MSNTSAIWSIYAVYGVDTAKQLPGWRQREVISAMWAEVEGDSIATLAHELRENDHMLAQESPTPRPFMWRDYPNNAIRLG